VNTAKHPYLFLDLLLTVFAAAGSATRN